jgi:hypothetical protein
MAPTPLFQVWLATSLNDDLEIINMWTKKWLVKINPDKTKSMIFSVERQKPLHPQLKYDNKTIEFVSSHVFNVYERAYKRLNSLKALKFRINIEIEVLVKLYKALIRPILEYYNN